MVALHTHLWDVVEWEIRSMKVHLKNLQELQEAQISDIHWNVCTRGYGQDKNDWISKFGEQFKVNF